MYLMTRSAHWINFVFIWGQNGKSGVARGHQQFNLGSSRPAHVRKAECVELIWEEQSREGLVQMITRSSEIKKFKIKNKRERKKRLKLRGRRKGGENKWMMKRRKTRKHIVSSLQGSPPDLVQHSSQFVPIYRPSDVLLYLQLIFRGSSLQRRGFSILACF